MPSSTLRPKFAVPALALALLVPGAPAAADDGRADGVRIASKSAVDAPERLHFTVRTSKDKKRVALRVDGRRRWVKRPSRGRFRHNAYLHTLHLRPGKHRLVVRATRRGGRVVKAVRVVTVEDTESSGTVASPLPGLDALLDAGFENGLADWNTAGVGDVVPSVVTDTVRTGDRSAKVTLSGTQSRSELILGGDDWSDTVEFREGDERFYGFSVNVKSMMYGRPGAHNLLMQFKSDGEGSPKFGLMLWDYQGKRGLWSHGEAMGGDRYLAPIAHGDWQDIVIHFKASREGAGFYRVYLNGQLIDSRDGVSMIRPDRSWAYIKNGLYRNGSEIPGDSEIRLDAARLGTTLEGVSPR
jgi:hypothetical protein